MWACLLAAAIGVWLTAAPRVLGYTGGVRLLHLVVGPIVASIALVAVNAVTRPVRRLNLLSAVALMASPALGEGAAAVNGALCALALALLSSVSAPVRQPLGGGWSALWTRSGARRIV